MIAPEAEVEAVLIAGPTASGKSALGVRLAEAAGGVVINADSMQVYRELSIVTARPEAADLARAPHLLYGHVPVAEAYSVGRWLAGAAAAIDEVRARGALPVIVGGTGLYFEALLNGLSPVPAIPATVRAHWRAEAARLGPAGLHAVLARRDAAMAAQLRLSDPQRVTRALEVLEATGRSLADWQQEAGAPVLAPERVLRVMLAPERAELYARCNARFDAMLAAGALDEVARLAALGLSPALPAMRATGVRELAAHLEGRLTLAAAAEAAKAETRRYAKRQATWIRGRMADWTSLPATSTDAAFDALSRLEAAAAIFSGGTSRVCRTSPPADSKR